MQICCFATAAEYCKAFRKFFLNGSCIAKIVYLVKIPTEYLISNNSIQNNVLMIFSF